MKFEIPFDLRSRDGSLSKGQLLTNATGEDAGLERILKRPGVTQAFSFADGFLKGAVKDWDNSWYVFIDGKAYQNAFTALGMGQTPQSVRVVNGGPFDWMQIKDGVLYLHRFDNPNHKVYSLLSESSTPSYIGSQPASPNNFQPGYAPFECAPVDIGGRLWAEDTGSNTLTAHYMKYSDDGGQSWSTDTLTNFFAVLVAAGSNSYVFGQRVLTSVEDSTLYLVSVCYDESLNASFGVFQSIDGITWSLLSQYAVVDPVTAGAVFLDGFAYIKTLDGTDVIVTAFRRQSAPTTTYRGVLANGVWVSSTLPYELGAISPILQSVNVGRLLRINNVVVAIPIHGVSGQEMVFTSTDYGASWTSTVIAPFADESGSTKKDLLLFDNHLVFITYEGKLCSIAFDEIVVTEAEQTYNLGSPPGQLSFVAVP